MSAHYNDVLNICLVFLRVSYGGVSCLVGPSILALLFREIEQLDCLNVSINYGSERMLAGVLTRRA